MAELFEQTLSKLPCELPQLSDSDLTLLDITEQHPTSNNELDSFDLDSLDEICLSFSQYIQGNQFSQIDPKHTIRNNQTFNSNFEHNNSNNIDELHSSFHQFSHCPLTNVIISNDTSNEQLFSKQNVEYNDFSDACFYRQSDKFGSVESSSYTNSPSFQSQQLICDNQLNVGQFVSSPSVELGESHAYPNEFINSPSIDQIRSPTSIDYSQQTQSPFDYRTIIHSPTNCYSVQSVSSSIDYSVQPLATYNPHSCSLTNSPSNSSLSSSPHASFASDSPSEFYDIYDSSNYSNNSKSFDQFTQFSTDNTSTVLQSQLTSFSSSNDSQQIKPKRKRSKKIVSEDEIRRKLELKAEKKRKRLERKKIQNKEAARRYREKKKFQDDQINHRLADVKEKYQIMRKQLKDTLNEKKVLLKLLKDFAEQSNDFLLPDWMKESDYLKSSSLL